MNFMDNREAANPKLIPTSGPATYGWSIGNMTSSVEHVCVRSCLEEHTVHVQLSAILNSEQL
jgi:hypothetical protein